MAGGDVGACPIAMNVVRAPSSGLLRDGLWSALMRVDASSQRQTERMSRCIVGCSSVGERR